MARFSTFGTTVITDSWSRSEGRTVLSDREVDQALAEQQGWRREGMTLVRKLVLRDFDEAMRFLERVAEMANDYGRRPDMCISEFNHVRLSISNLHHARFTLAEIRLAAKVNAVIDEHHSHASRQS
jgi:4a-hydroxytetrahydrobiopterin dehydratase